MGTKLSTYEKNGKSYPILELLSDDDKYKFSFGVSKGRMILKNLDAIRSFVDSNTKTP